MSNNRTNPSCVKPFATSQKRYLILLLVPILFFKPHLLCTTPASLVESTVNHNWLPSNDFLFHRIFWPLYTTSSSTKNEVVQMLRYPYRVGFILFFYMLLVFIHIYNFFLYDYFLRFLCYFNVLSISILHYKLMWLTTFNLLQTFMSFVSFIATVISSQTCKDSFLLWKFPKMIISMLVNTRYCLCPYTLKPVKVSRNAVDYVSLISYSILISFL